MKVKALRTGYINHKRVKPGTVFYMHESEYFHLDKDGKKKVDPETGEARVCQWVELVEDTKPKAEIPVDEPPVEPPVEETIDEDIDEDENVI